MEHKVLFVTPEAVPLAQNVLLFMEAEKARANERLLETFSEIATLAAEIIQEGDRIKQETPDDKSTAAA